MKALFTADLHLSNNLPYSRPLEDGITDRFAEQLKLLGKIKSIAKRESVDAVFILGDIFDRRLIDAPVLSNSVSAISKIARVADTYILPGNHEAHSVNAKHFLPEVFSKIGNKRLHYLGFSSVVKFDNYTFYAVPWCKTEQAIGRIARIKKHLDLDSLNCLLLHHAVIGATDRNWICDDGLTPSSLGSFNLVLSGHFHKRQKFSENGFYVGAPMQHDFGDANEQKRRGVYIYSFDDDGFECKRVPIKSPQFYSFRLNGELGENLRGVSTNDYVRIGIEADTSGYKKLAREMALKLDDWKIGIGANLSFYQIPVQHYESRLDMSGKLVSKKYTPSDIIKQYVQIVDNTGLDSNELAKVGRNVFSDALKSLGMA